ncbi:MAG: hypothetical protein JW727_02825 [Candidatus Aenigmarchaeota archaeon]|nr:hypothetical protein [Candidatus Aenigmarchaeota archaeon]
MNGIEKRIVELLKTERGGLNISSISRRLGVERVTLTNHLYRLMGSKTIRMHPTGNEKLCFLEDTLAKDCLQRNVLPLLLAEGFEDGD